MASCVAAQSSTVLSGGPPQASHAPESLKLSRQKPSALTIEQAAQDYLEDQRSKHRRPKTLEWHEKALGLFQHYLLTEHECVLLDRITQAQVRGWFAALPQIPTATGALRSLSTAESYARSARAFCQWVVRHRYLSATPFADLLLPPVENGLSHPLEPGEWEQLLLACHPPMETGVIANQAAARNRAILWVLFETGMQVTELCRLRLGDVDQEQKVLSVLGSDSKARQLTLGLEGWRCLLIYLEHSRSRAALPRERRDERSEPLFLSETGDPLTKSAVNLLFDRLGKRAGMTSKKITASLLRKNFAARYLQAGGNPVTLQRLLGCTHQATFARTHEMSVQMEWSTNARNP